ncbi:hypothetical protein JOQ06_013573 [Pogonophryne albipinna]|uniref:Uncharacterized protein n=1 Tax=Pogonophryne albipinna TaxID=1090488 RepID=A0AAD6FRF8_9TELE|nr:hypothetical protein JOQ06_013573 [Pogonophryne albipinna]
MLGTNLSVPCIAKLLGVSSSTIFRRMREFGLSVSELYSSISDEELDNVVISIKNDMPTAGYRMGQRTVVILLVYVYNGQEWLPQCIEWIP